jgi:hypothetical protein
MQNESLLPTRSITSLNKVMQINLIFLFLQSLQYGGLPELMLGLHNPFANFVMALTFAAIIGLWLCLDFMLPIYMEAKINKQKPVSRPAGWMLMLNVAALSGALVYWIPSLSTFA